MKKGFTLIELLAVIIVLSIIALIATPIVLDVIEDSKKSAAKSSASMILNSANLHYAEQFMKTNNNFKGYECSITNKQGCNELSIDGEKPDTAIITINDKGRVNGKIVFGEYTYYICDNKISETESSNCSFIDYSLIYEITESGVITGLKDNEQVTNYIKGKELTIPESINGIKVIEIQSNAFSNLDIVKVKILSTTNLTIGENAFPSTIEKLEVKSCVESLYSKYQNILEVIVSDCQYIVQEPPTITYIVEEGIINSEGWAKEDFYVTINVTDNSGYGIKEFRICTTSDDMCNPISGSLITGSTSTTRLISTESDNNRVCVQAVDNMDVVSEVVCSDAYKLDKKAPTILITEKLRMAQGTNLYSLNDYFKNNGLSDMSTTCINMNNNMIVSNTNNLDIGSYKLNCTVTKANGLSTNSTIEIDVVAANKCIRATKLHTEICTQSTYYCGGAGYINGSTITYGNLGTKGTLASGNAFECDVNGDGIYDASAERFYYVSDLYNTKSKSFDTNYAVFIYYNNTTKGIADKTNSSSIVYSSQSSKNWYGPSKAIENLPTISQWSNVSLSNTTRAIITDTGATSTKGGKLPTAFSYAKYAARLLTYQELSKACGGDGNPTSNGELDTCNYLMENTNYSSSSMGTTGYWLESPYANTDGNAWLIHVQGRYLIANGVNAPNFGVRPAIEVLKTDIEY